MRQPRGLGVACARWRVGGLTERPQSWDLGAQREKIQRLALERTGPLALLHEGGFWGGTTAGQPSAFGSEGFRRLEHNESFAISARKLALQIRGTHRGRSPCAVGERPARSPLTLSLGQGPIFLWTLRPRTGPVIECKRKKCFPSAYQQVNQGGTGLLRISRWSGHVVDPVSCLLRRPNMFPRCCRCRCRCRAVAGAGELI